MIHNLTPPNPALAHGRLASPSAGEAHPRWPSWRGSTLLLSRFHVENEWQAYDQT